MSAPGGVAEFRALLEAQLDRAYWVARRVCGSAALADEAVQDAYIRLLKSPPAQRDPAECSAYILLTVRHTALNLLKSERSRKGREQNYPTVNSMRDADSTQDSPERAELAAAARSAMTQLPGEQREAVALCCELGLSWGEASQVLEVPRQTVGDRVNKGLERLRTVLVSRGYAALAPLLLAKQLQELGIPHAPDTLVHAVGKMTASQAVNGVAKAALKTAGKRAAVASSSKFATLALVLTVMAGSAGTFWWTRQNTAPTAPTAAASLINFDFEDGARPPLLTKGTVVIGPPRAGNRFCVEAVPEADPHANRKDVRFDNNGQTLFKITAGMELRFNCYLDSSLNDLTVYVIDRTDHVWKSVVLPMRAGEWKQTTLKFSDIKDLKLDTGATIDVEALMFIAFSRQPVTLYIDDVHVTRSAPAAESK